MKRYLAWLVYLALGSILVACARSQQEFGILEGHVTIGPRLPIATEEVEEPTPDPAAYAGRQVVVFKADGRTEVARLNIDVSGRYRGELPVGTYVVDINHVGMDSASDFPKKVEITDQGVTRLDIEIDTGVR